VFLLLLLLLVLHQFLHQRLQCWPSKPQAQATTAVAAAA
jgi:hypothetical protein